MSLSLSCLQHRKTSKDVKVKGNVVLLQALGLAVINQKLCLTLFSFAAHHFSFMK